VKKAYTFRKIIFGAFIFFVNVTGVYAATFVDIDDNHPNAAAIDYLSKEGVIAGYDDGSFRPENLVNRAEALKILLLASEVEIQNPTKDVFPDVPVSEWFAPFVFSAKNFAIVNGYPDGNFRPENSINLVETLKILFNTNAVELENYATDSQLFTDSEAMAWYNPFLFYAKTFVLVEPDSANQIFPATPLTRGALAEIIFRFRTRVENICPQFLENATELLSNHFREVLLNQNFPNVFYENEVFNFTGSVLENGEMTAVLENRDDKTRRQFFTDTFENNFVLPVEFRSPGHYNFSIIPSTTDRNSSAIIEILPRECSPATIDVSGVPPRNLTTKIFKNKPTIFWEDSDNNIFWVVIRQNKNFFERIVSVGQNSLTLDPADFIGFENGLATAQVFSAQSENGFTHEPRTAWFGSAILNLNLGKHHFSTIDSDKISVFDLPNFFANQISFSGSAKVELENTIFLISPDGLVSEFEIRAGDSVIAPGENFTISLNLPMTGTYFIEINSIDGVAVLNHPIYLSSELPLLPDFADLRSLPNPNRKISINREKMILLRLINEFRLSQGLSSVLLDDEISDFAQNYAEQMAGQNFFGHVDLVGRDPDSRRIIFKLQMPVGENLARDLTTEDAHAGLLRSAAHRQNLLDPSWTRVGLGIAEIEDDLIFVEEFSADQINAGNLAEAKNELFEAINSRRAQNNLPEFILDSSLDSVAQNWSEKMATENFVNFQNGDDSLEKNIRSVEPQDAFSSFLISAGNISQIAESLSGSILVDSSKSQVAIGLAMDSVGKLTATFIFR